MNLLQCLACAPAPIAATGDPRALADYWRGQGIGPCSFLYEHTNEPVKYGTNCLVDLSKKQDQRDFGNGYVLDIEPDDYLAVGVQLAAAVRAVNAATLPSAGGDGRATRACSLYDLPVQRERTPWDALHMAVWKSRNEAMAAVLVPQIECCTLSMYPYGTDSADKQARRIAAHVAECRRVAPKLPVRVVYQVTYLADSGANTRTWASREVTLATLRTCEAAGVRDVVLWSEVRGDLDPNGIRVIDGTEPPFAAVAEWMRGRAI